MSEYIVKDVVCDSGIFIVDDFGNEELVEVCNSRANALKICKILNADLKHMVYEDASIRELIELHHELQQKNDQLKQQLVEKEKGIEDRIKQIKTLYVQLYELQKAVEYCQDNHKKNKLTPLTLYNYTNEKHNQDKMSFAIDKLKKLKDRLSSMQWCFTGRRNFLQEVEFIRKSQEEMIDEEIEDLLKEMKGV